MLTALVHHQYMSSYQKLACTNALQIASISADAHGLCDAASHPTDNIVLHTELDAKCNHPATNVGLHVIAPCYIN